MKKINREFSLTNENIAAVCNDIESILKKRKSPSKEIVKIRFKAEEALYFYQQTFGTDAKAILKYQLSNFGKFSIIVPGNKDKPFNRDRDEYIENIFRRMGELDSWDYRNGNNILDFTIPKRPLSQVKQMLIAIACVIVFALISKLFSAQTVELIKTSVFDPIANTFISVLRSAAGILIFTSIVLSILNIGDVKSFSKIGKSLFSRIFLFTIVTCFIVLLALIPWIRISDSSGSGILSLTFELIKTLLELIPADPISPFISGNAIHIIMLALLTGIVSLLLEGRLKTIKKLIESVDGFIVFLFEKLNALTPILVFVIMSGMAIGNDINSVLQYKTMLITAFIAILLTAVINILLSCVFCKKSPKEYFKLAGKPLAVSFLTCSSAAALPYNMDVCKNNLHINDGVANLGIPIGQTMFMPASAALLISFCVSISSVESLPISISWIITAVIICTLMAISTPPVPGAYMMILSLILSQLNLPADYLGICITICCITDGTITTLNINGLHYFLANVNNSLKTE